MDYAIQTWVGWRSPTDPGCRHLARAIEVSIIIINGANNNSSNDEGDDSVYDKTVVSPSWGKKETRSFWLQEDVHMFIE